MLCCAGIHTSPCSPLAIVLRAPALMHARAHPCTPMQVLYDEDLAEEDLIMAWHGKRDAGAVIGVPREAGDEVSPRGSSRGAAEAHGCAWAGAAGAHGCAWAGAAGAHGCAWACGWETRGGSCGVVVWGLVFYYFRDLTVGKGFTHVCVVQVRAAAQPFITWLEEAEDDEESDED